jgi:hypothetical protein
MELTHQILIIIIILVVDDSHFVALVESAQPTSAESITVHRRAALEARLAEALVKAFAQRASGDFRVEFAS